MARGKRNKNNEETPMIGFSQPVGSTTKLNVTNDVLIIEDDKSMPEVLVEAQPLIMDDAAKLTTGITEPELIVSVVNKTPEVDIESTSLKLELNETNTPLITNEECISDKYVKNTCTAVNSSNSWDLDPVAIKGDIKPKTKEQVEDNPFGKKVKTVIERVEHNVNNERMTDSELMDNVMLL